VHVKPVEVHNQRKPETPTGIHGLDADVAELDEHCLAARPAKRLGIESGDLLCLSVPTSPIRDRTSSKTNELG
jgi:hypothetical protein